MRSLSDRNRNQVCLQAGGNTANQVVCSQRFGRIAGHAFEQVAGIEGGGIATGTLAQQGGQAAFFPHVQLVVAGRTICAYCV